MDLIGGEMHDNRPQRLEGRCQRKPLRCSDELCPSKDKCLRPNFEGESHNFSHNRGVKAICAYLVEQDAQDA